MLTETRKVYKCEHCGKWYLSASACSVHEKFCRKKPENQHKCFKFCANLEMLNTYPKKQMICKVTGEEMYSFKWERRCYYNGWKSVKEGLIRMPLTCDSFKEMKQDYDGNYITEQEDK